ncbi:MAG: GlsB/YeaQ/YmgE family stress response membrane protein [Candidatus Saccharibacteria bacterium]
MLLTIISWIILGLIAGWVASIITGTNERVNGWMNVVVGVLGAVIGGLVLRLFGVDISSGFSFGSLITAILGAVILLAIVKSFRRDRSFR